MPFRNRFKGPVQSRRIEFRITTGLFCAETLEDVNVFERLGSLVFVMLNQIVDYQFFFIAENLAVFAEKLMEGLYLVPCPLDDMDLRVPWAEG